MNEILKNAINRSAPIDTPIAINIEEFLHIFENEKLYNEYREAIKSVVGEISNILKFHCGRIFLPVYATITLSDDNSKELVFSGENIFSCIREIFHPMDMKMIFDICETPGKFKDVAESVIKIKTPEELKRKYPVLYDLYLDQIKFNEGIETYERVMNNPHHSFEHKMECEKACMEYLREFYPEIDIKREVEFYHNFSLESFLVRMMKVVRDALMNADSIINLYQSAYLELNSFNPDDKEKLDLFIAATFMKLVETPNFEDKQRYLFHLTNYFKENVETKITRTKIKFEEKKVTPLSLYERYKHILVSNPELLAVNFSSTDFKDMNQNEVEEFISAYLSDLSANWELLPHDDTSVERNVRESAKRKYRKLSIEEQKLRQERLINLYTEKKTFYDSTDPYIRIKGKNVFDGYVGYIYSNGLVILEKFYSNVEEKKIADNEAIYVIRMGDFYELSRHSKSYLIANNLCNRVIHKKGWQARVLGYIKRKRLGNNPSADTNKLITEKKVILNEKTL